MILIFQNLNILLYKIYSIKQYSTQKHISQDQVTSLVRVSHPDSLNFL